MGFNSGFKGLSALVYDTQLGTFDVGYHNVPYSLILHEWVNMYTENIRVIKPDLQVVICTEQLRHILWVFGSSLLLWLSETPQGKSPDYWVSLLVNIRI